MLCNHWILLLFCLKESAIYVFDPSKQERKIRLAKPALTAYKLYVREGGLMNNRKEFLWHHSEYPRQEGGTECGFFVMRVLVQGTIPKRKLKRYESFGHNFLL
ncbi:uncharacterized protein LOC141686887 [Apium graveolens]|uniref:uncharacterized protein LOC141686887 n=1 Tax=Apium graveolens TaxID=4045 RepID=UPI003D7A8C12